MTKFIVTIIAGQKEQKKILECDSFTLGRGRENQVTIIHSGISRNHLRVFLEEGRVFVEDRGSTNGTKVSGQQLESAVKYPYQQEQEIVLGTCPAVIKIEYQNLEEGQEISPVEELAELEESESLGKADYHLKDFEHLPEVELGSPQEDSRAQIAMDIPGGGQVFDFDATNATDRVLLNLEVSLEAGNNAFVDIKERCTIGSGDVDFKVEEESIKEHHATFFQHAKTLVMVLHQGRATFKRKRLKPDSRYVLYKGAVIQLENLKVKVVEGQTLLLKQNSAKGIKSLLTKEEEASEVEEVAEEQVELTLKEKIHEYFMMAFHYLTFDAFKPKQFDFGEDADNDYEDEEDDDNDQISEKKLSLVEKFLSFLKKKIKTEDDNDGESGEDEEEQKFELDNEPSEMIEIATANFVSRLVANGYDFLSVFALLKVTGPLDFGEWGDLIVLFVIAQFLVTLILGVSFGQLIVGIGSCHSNRFRPLIRLLVGYVTTPLIIFDLPILKQLPSLKEKVSKTRLTPTSRFRVIAATVALIPLFFVIVVYFSFNAREITQVLEVHDLSTKKNYEVSVEAENVVTGYLGFEVTSDLKKYNLEAIPVGHGKKIEINFLDLNSYAFFRFGLLKNYSLGKGFSLIGKGNPLLFIHFPALTKLYNSGLPKNYTLSAKETSELIQFVKVSLSLDQDSLVDHVMKYGPFIDGFVAFKDYIFEILGGRVPSKIDIITLGNLKFLRLVLFKGQEGVSEILLSLNQEKGSMYRLTTQNNPKAIRLREILYKSFLGGINWSIRRKVGMEELNKRDFDRFYFLDLTYSHRDLLEDQKQKLIDFALGDLKRLTSHQEIEPNADRESFARLIDKLIDYYLSRLRIEQDDPLRASFEAFRL